MDDLLLGLVALVISADLFDLKASGLMIATAQPGDFKAEVAKNAKPAAEIFGIAAIPCGEFGSVARGEDGGEVIRNATASGAGELAGIFREFAEVG